MQVYFQWIPVSKCSVYEYIISLLCYGLSVWCWWRHCSVQMGHVSSRGMCWCVPDVSSYTWSGWLYLMWLWILTHTRQHSLNDTRIPAGHAKFRRVAFDSILHLFLIYGMLIMHIHTRAHAHMHTHTHMHTHARAHTHNGLGGYTFLCYPRRKPCGLGMARRWAYKLYTV